MALGAPNLPKRCQRAPLAACRPANARKRAQDGPCPPNQTGGPLCCHPGGLGFAQLWPKCKVAAPPRAVPRPRGVAHSHFFGQVHGPAEGNRDVSYHPGGLGMQFLRALLKNQACSHPGGVACQEPPPPGSPTRPLGLGRGLFRAPCVVCSAVLLGVPEAFWALCCVLRGVVRSSGVLFGLVLCAARCC